MLALPSRSELRTRPLVSHRVSLAPLEGPDAHELWEVVNGSRLWLQPWLPWVPFQKNVESSQRFVEASVADWDSGRALRFSIRARNPHNGGRAGQLIGIVGLEACIEMHRSCELGYWLRHDASRQGLMTEAAALCVDFGFRSMGMHRVRVAAATGNHPSLRVVGRLGFHFEGIARHAEWCDGRWLDHAVFSLLEHEWRGLG